VKVERASAVQHTRPSMRKMVTAGCPGGPGRRPVARAWPSRHLASAAAAGSGLLRCNSGQAGRTGTFLGCVRLDSAAKVHSLQGCSAAPSGCPCAPPNDFGIRTPHFASFSPHQFWMDSQVSLKSSESNIGCVLKAIY